MSKANKTAYTRTEGEYESLERKLEDARKLLMQCRDTIQASIAEEGISDSRRLYRTELYNHIQDQLKEK